MFEEDKQRPKEHQRSYRKAKKLTQKIFIFFTLLSMKNGAKSFNF